MIVSVLKKKVLELHPPIKKTPNNQNPCLLSSVNIPGFWQEFKY